MEISHKNIKIKIANKNKELLSSKEIRKTLEEIVQKIKDEKTNKYIAHDIDYYF